MAFTFIALVKGENDSGSAITTLDATASLNVQAGDLLIAWVKHEGLSTTLAVAKNSGSPANAHTFDAADYVSHANNDCHGSFGYVLSAAADATMTPRLTLGAARPYVRFLVMQFRPDAGETVSKSGSNKNSGNGTAISSGTFSPSGNDIVACGGFGEYGATTTSSEQINGVAATEPTGSPATYSSVWYRILTAGFTNGQATATVSTSDWICAGIAFSAAAAVHVPPDYEDEPPRQITRRTLYALHEAWEPEEWLAAWAAALTSITASDTLAPGITDAVSAIAASLASSDTLTPGVTDAVSSIAATLAVADTVAVQVVDAAALLAALSASDTLAPGVTDTAAIAVVIAASDTLAPGITDAVSGVMAALSVSDTLAPSITDALSNIAATLSVSDVLATGVTDAVSSILATLAASDTVTVQVVDASALLAALSASDSLAPGVTDAASVTILASTLGKMLAIIAVKPALAGDASATAALGAAPDVKPVIGGKPNLH